MFSLLPTRDRAPREPLAPNTTAATREGRPAPAVKGPQPQPPGRAPAGGRRLAWLDALRGIAALCVVYAHFGTRVLPKVHTAVYNFFDPGLYGVLVFFMISGYIVPASLERKGSVRTFWLSRLFRLFPLFVFAVAAVLLLHDLGWASLRGTNTNVTASAFAHLFMLNDLLGGSDVIVVLWTLSYEMVFYLLLTALFTAGLHQRSGRLAGGFAIGALLLGGLLPTVWLSHSALGPTGVALGCDALIMSGLVLAVASRGRSRALGAWLAAATALVLVVFNERAGAFEGLTILALMFTGTMLYRAEQGQIRRGRAVAAAIGVFAAAIAAGAWHISADGAWHIPLVSAQRQTMLHQREWAVSVALAGLTFAIGMALRHLRVPSVLAWLGLVSYSLYLLHPLLIDVYDAMPLAHGHRPAGLQVALGIGFLAVLLACCALTYHLVEAPMQRLGRQVTARLDARFGPDRADARLQPARPLRLMLAGGHDR